jgi:hypothetical protein
MRLTSITRIELIGFIFILFLFQNASVVSADTSELSATVSVSQDLDWFPLPYHPWLTHDVFTVTVVLKAESDFAGGYVSVSVIPLSVTPQIVYRSEHELGVLTKGQTTILKDLFQTVYAGAHCIKLGFGNLLGRADKVTFLVGGTPLGDNCALFPSFLDKSLFFAMIPSGILAIATIGLVAVTALYTQQTKRLVDETRKSRKVPRADERRVRIYAPLYDELTEVQKALQNYGRTGLGNWREYQKIKSEHIRYLIPCELRDRITQLYEQNLEEFEKGLMKLQRKHETEIRDYLLERMPDRDTLSASTVQNLYRLALYLPRGQLPDESDALDLAFRGARKHGHLEHDSLPEFFRYWVSRIKTDKDFEDLNEHRRKTLCMLADIENEIGRELEAED